MENEKKQYQFEEHDFELVQENVVIKDKKLDTKPTTFFRDAIKRFAHNKASVVSGIILGILILCAIFVPIFSPHNVDPKNVSSNEKFLAPKLFKTGTGFWDGTRKYKNQVYDIINGCPVDVNSLAVLPESLKVYPVQYINQANKHGHNGYVVFASDTTDLNKRKTVYMETIKTRFDGTRGYKVTINYGDIQDVSSSKLGEYRIIISYEENKQAKEVILKDWSTNYPTEPETIDISAIFKETNTSAVNGSFRFEVKCKEDSFQYILLKSVEFECSKLASNYETVTQELSFTDATQMVLLTKTNKNEETGKETVNNSYWESNGRKGVYNSEIYYCDFVFDTYADVYGDTKVTYALSELNDMVKKGYLTFEFILNEEDYTQSTVVFDILSDKCPFKEDGFISCKVNRLTKKLLSVDVYSQKYHKFGYDEMPKFILGTDLTGQDLLTKAFKGLRTSLILGLCTAAFCFMFGLIWGSISGYFGGNVDIFMERFCDILGGIPWIVVMTLAILHIGNNFTTFFLALCLTGWMGTAARTRTQFYRFKGREYVLSSRTLGSSDMRLIFKHILPNSLGTIITGAVLMIPSTIFSEATLAYLNLGLQGVNSFGVMMSNNQPYLELYPVVVIFPAIIMALMMISFNLFGNGLRDAFNPSLKGSE